MQNISQPNTHPDGERPISVGMCYVVLATVLILNQAFYLLSGRLHPHIFNYLISVGYDKYTADFTITTVKNILIIGWQILLILAGLRLCRITQADMGWRPPEHFKRIAASVLILVSYKILRTLFFGNTDGVFSPHFGLSGFWNALNNPVVYYHLIIVPFISPLFEELIYRGVVFTILEKKLGWKWAVFGSALFFSAFHTSNLISFSFEIFLKGIIYGLLRKWDGSIWSSTAAHSTNNLLAAWFTISI
jgi:membrane protease YdiL (CAAX protease family)